MALKKGLGKGLNALIEPAMEYDREDTPSGVVEVEINLIEPNSNQPRKHFDEEGLKELALSMASYGVIQPLLVKDEGGYFSIIAGERRWRAARMAKLDKIPVIIRDYNEAETLQVALIENLQREDLNPIEEAQCFQKLRDEFFYTQEDIAEKVGKSRNSISYSLNLLNLDQRVQNFISEGKLSGSHGRSLLLVKELNQQFELAEMMIEGEMSSREGENLVKKFLTQKDETQKQEVVKLNPYEYVETDLKQILGTKVQIKPGKKKGKIEIEYYSPEELDRLLCIFKSIEVEE